MYSGEKVPCPSIARTNISPDQKYRMYFIHVSFPFLLQRTNFPFQYSIQHARTSRDFSAPCSLITTCSLNGTGLVCFGAACSETGAREGETSRAGEARPGDVARPPAYDFDPSARHEETVTVKRALGAASREPLLSLSSSPFTMVSTPYSRCD